MRSGICSETTNFNPRSREGSDSAIRETCGSYNISIHAPAKGATSMDDRLIRIETISIHAPAKGATAVPQFPIFHLHYFNPRSREGSDRAVLLILQHQTISIHAPAKGATDDAVKAAVDAENFNPRSREGSDNIIRKFGRSRSHFNPRSREGSDPCAGGVRSL